MKSQDRAVIQQLPLAELKAQLQECQEKLFKLRLANSMSPLKNGLQIRNLHRHQARLMTWIHQKETKGKIGKELVKN